MKNFTLVIMAASAFVLPACSFAQAPSNPVTSEVQPGGLNPGDEIRIVVWRKPEFSGDFVIAGNGTVIHPLYREVQVTGVPLSVVEDRLRAFLTKFETSPQFVMQPLVRIIVGGAVKSPNIYPVPPETTITQAITLAGGPLDNGDLSKVRIIRDRQEVNIDLSRVDSESGLLVIRSGDQVLVGKKRGSILAIIGPITSTIAAAAAITTVIRRR
jgi:protein involved in polysaccharide export with SLBB domain